jgi:hypothetical protein
MKKNYKILFVLPFLMALNTYGQTNNTSIPQNSNELKNTTDNYLKDIETLKKVPGDEDILFNEKMLNVFFSNEISKNFYGTNDLTLQKFYTSIDAEDNSLAFGTTFIFNQTNKLQPLDWVFNAGIKAKLEDKFSTIFKNGKLDNSELGITGKISYIGNGSLNYPSKTDQKRYNSIVNYRALIQKKYSEKIKKYIESDYKAELDSLKAIKADLKENDTIYTDFIKEKYETFYKSIADEEIAFIKKNKMYNFFTDWWWSFDFFVPVGEKKYKHTDSETNPNYLTSAFYPLKLTSSITKFWKWSAGQSIYLTAQISTFNNNSFLLDSANKVSFQTITNQSPTKQSVSNSEDVYIGDYNKFITTAFRAELVFFPFDFVGFSPAIEKNAGSYYHKTNWKLGIPFSLKDKDEKPTVNFEVQWKEQNDNHYVGISVSYVFGKFIK